MSSHSQHKSIKTQATLPQVLPNRLTTNRTNRRTLNISTESNNRYKLGSFSHDQLQMQSKRKDSSNHNRNHNILVENSRYGKSGRRKTIGNVELSSHVTINTEKLFQLQRDAKERQAIFPGSQTQDVRPQVNQQKQQRIRSIYFPKDKSHRRTKQNSKLFSRKKQTEIHIVQMNAGERTKINSKPDSANITISVTDDQLPTISEEATKNKATIFSSNSQLKQYQSEVKKEVYQTLSHLKPCSHDTKLKMKDASFESYLKQREQQISLTSSVLTNLHQMNEEKQQKVLRFNYQPQLEIIKQVDRSSLVFKKYTNGTYLGQISEEGHKEGLGILFFQNGKLYQGQFKQDMKHGQGYQMYPQGAFYVGHFQNGQKNGKGRFEWPNGEVYEGQWKNGRKHGSGLWEGKDAIQSYIGEWKNGLIQGFGVLLDEKGSRYEGQFNNSMKHGKGTLRLQNGQTFIGQFRKNVPNGYGEYYWINGDHYRGDFSNGLRHGKGTQKFSSGMIFNGEFRNDKKSGFGEEKYEDGVTYIGNFENNYRHGYGELYCDGKSVYKGYWINNKSVQVSDTPAIIEEEKEGIQSIMGQRSKENLRKEITKDQSKSRKSLNNNLSKNRLRSYKSSAKSLLKAQVQHLYNNKSSESLDKDQNYKRACNCSRKH